MSHLSMDNDLIFFQISAIEKSDISDIEKRKEYQKFKISVKNSLIESYSKCESKLKFYKDSLSKLSFFETDYLMLNLFFEKDFEPLYNVLILNGHFVNLRFENEDNISYKYFKYRKQTLSTTAGIEDFLKIEFGKLLSNITDVQWEGEIIGNSNSFVTHDSSLKKNIVGNFAEWVILKGLTLDDSNLFYYSYQLFCKLWNHFEVFKKESEKKSIELFAYLNKNLKSIKIDETNLDLGSLLGYVKAKYDDLFVGSLLYLPILNRGGSAINTTLEKLMENFQKQIDLLSKLKRCYKFESFKFIFDELINEKEDIIVEKLHQEVNSRLNRSDLPSEKEQSYISSLICKEKIELIRQGFFRRQYLFEEIVF